MASMVDQTGLSFSRVVSSSTVEQVSKSDVPLTHRVM